MPSRARLRPRAPCWPRPRSSAAPLLRAQLLFFLGEDYEAHRLLSHLVFPDFRPENLLIDPLFTEELLPLLFIEHARSASPGHSSVVQAGRVASQVNDLMTGRYRDLQARVQSGCS
jgi:hypothetical protein